MCDFTGVHCAAPGASLKLECLKLENDGAHNKQIPEKSLDEPAREVTRKPSVHSVHEPERSPTPPPPNALEYIDERTDGSDETTLEVLAVTSPTQIDYDGAVEQEHHDDMPPEVVVPQLRRPRLVRPRRRRLSMYESSDGGMDLESDVIGGSARSI